MGASFFTFITLKKKKKSLNWIHPDKREYQSDGDMTYMDLSFYIRRTCMKKKKKVSSPDYIFNHNLWYHNIGIHAIYMPSSFTKWVATESPHCSSASMQFRRANMVRETRGTDDNDQDPVNAPEVVPSYLQLYLMWLHLNHNLCVINEHTLHQ